MPRCLNRSWVIVVPGDLKIYFRAGPFVNVFQKIELAINDQPDYLVTGNHQFPLSPLKSSSVAGESILDGVI